MMSHIITENCIGCTACMKMCPVFAIDGNMGERLVINNKRCVDCGVCGRTCPKGAINDASGKPCERVSRAEWPKPTVDTTICSACNICVNICTAGVLDISRPRFQGDIVAHAEVVNEKKCVACEQCEKACPIGAIKLIEAEGVGESKSTPPKPAFNATSRFGPNTIEIIHAAPTPKGKTPKVDPGTIEIIHLAPGHHATPPSAVVSTSTNETQENTSNEKTKEGKNENSSV